MRYILLSFFIISSSAFSKRPENEIPEYGGQHQSSLSRDPENSKDATDKAWKFLQKGDLDTTIKRFNQAWLLDGKNHEAYWGFGIICGKRAIKGENPEENFKKSIEYLNKSIGMALHPSVNLLTDLGVSTLNYGGYLDEHGKKEASKNKLKDADQVFSKAAKIDSSYPSLYEHWSYTLFHLCDYSGAKNKKDAATALGVKFPPEYTRELLEKGK